MQMANTLTQKVVVFDLGKVLVDFDYSIAARRIAARSSKSMTSLVSFLSASSPLLVKYESGQVTREEFFQQVSKGTGYQGGIKEFSNCFNDVFFEIPAMVKLHSELRGRGMATYILSNTNDLAIEHVNHMPFYRNFDGYVYSYEVGAMKPDARIYEALEKMCGRQGGDIIYLDDREENINGAEQRGWQAYLHETPEKTRAMFEQIGLIEGYSQPGA